MNEEQVKGLTLVVLSVALSRIGVVIIPIVLFLIAMFIDFGTGVMAAKARNQAVSSAIAHAGIMKKVSSIVAVGVCMLIDVMIIYGTEFSGNTLPLYFILTITITVLMFLTEVISILENVNDLGANIPKFLLPLMRNIRSKVEDKAKDTLQYKEQEEEVE